MENLIQAEKQGYGEGGVGLAVFMKLNGHGIEKCANCVHDNDNADVSFLHFQGQDPPLFFWGKR